MSIVERMVRTSHADIAVAETSGKKLPVVFLHGNSSCKEVFRRQLESPLSDAHRLLAIDLPGHGRSSNAFDPVRTYSMPGYAAAVIETLAALGVEQAIVVGWSLGGHVGMELLPRFPGLVGLMILGAPPVRRDSDEIMKGFKPTPALMLAGKKDFTEEDFRAFADLTVGDLADATLLAALRRTDGLARSLNFESLLAGQASDQRELVETSTVPIAVVNGANDPIVNLDYIGGLSYRHLWDQHCFVLRGLGHVPFAEAPEMFNAILSRFVGEMEEQAVKTPRTHRTRTAVTSPAGATRGAAVGGRTSPSMEIRVQELRE